MMNRVFLLFFLKLFVLSAISGQLTISTDLRTDGVWNDKSNEWEVISEDDEELTFFKFNKDMSMFRHITPGLTSAYLIESQSYDEESDQYTFEVTSDVGNKYVMVIDLEANQIRFVYDANGKSYLVQHRIKKAWTEEE